MILSPYERADSPWVYIQFSAGKGQKRKFQKTKIRKDDPQKAKKIEKVLAFKKWEIKSAEPVEESESSWAWVPGYLRTRYAKGRTLDVYLFQWGALSKFLRERKIYGPALLGRQHCTTDYVVWRTAQVKEKSGKNPSVNTAKGELKLLALLMDEAVELGMAEKNPARKLKIRGVDPKVKPEITDEEAEAIYRALAKKPAWMYRSFHIGLQTGLRFAETRILRSQVQLGDGLIQVEDPKGGTCKAFSIPIYHGIRAMIEEFWASKEPVLWSLPPDRMSFASLFWTRFFKENGLPHLCFHCTRVTFITRGARAGVPESAMMAMVNHGSTDIHRIYRRFRGVDAKQYLDRMSLPVPPASGATG